MSGIAGIVRRLPTGVSVDLLGKMAATIRHRGPDGYGFYVGQRVGFAHVRLGVVDIAGGAQPLTNKDGQIVVTYNGEIYNHPELRRELEQKGHVFRTRSDTEVLVHGYEEWGVNLLDRLNGQFAFAIYDRNTDTVFIARDRFGVRPLFYAQRKGALYFGSEISPAEKSKLHWTAAVSMKPSHFGLLAHLELCSPESHRWSPALTEF